MILLYPPKKDFLLVVLFGTKLSGQLIYLLFVFLVPLYATLFLEKCYGY